MYNRYIPQPDGSYRRSKMKEPNDCAPPKKQPPEPPVQPQVSLPQPPEQPRQHPRPERRNPHPVSAGSFLKQLLPKDFDTGDLIVVLLLLLMAGDCQEEQNTALLTLALYLFM